MKTISACLCLCLLSLPCFAQTTQPSGEGVAVTVYNGGYGVVRESRSLDIGADGLARFTDVARQIDPTTVHFVSRTDPSAKLLELLELPPAARRMPAARLLTIRWRKWIFAYFSFILNFPGIKSKRKLL